MRRTQQRERDKYYLRLAHGRRVKNVNPRCTQSEYEGSAQRVLVDAREQGEVGSHPVRQATARREGKNSPAAKAGAALVGPSLGRDKWRCARERGSRDARLTKETNG